MFELLDYLCCTIVCLSACFRICKQHPPISTSDYRDMLFYLSQSLSLMRLSRARNQAVTVTITVKRESSNPSLIKTREIEKRLQNWTLAYFICVGLCSFLLFFGSYRESLKYRPVDCDRWVGDHCSNTTVTCIWHGTPMVKDMVLVWHKVNFILFKANHSHWKSVTQI